LITRTLLFCIGFYVSDLLAVTRLSLAKVLSWIELNGYCVLSPSGMLQIP